MNLLDFDAFFFDFDGLLVDTEPLHYKAYQVLLSDLGFKLPWDLTTYCHYAHQKTEIFANAVYSLFPAFKELYPDWMHFREQKQALYQDFLLKEPVALMPGVQKTLMLLQEKKLPIYVATNATQRQVAAIKHQHEVLEKIPTWITREHYTHPKPAPDCYLKALEIHGDPSCRGIGFEDAIRGIQSLQKTPLLPVLILPNHYPKPSPSQLHGVKCFSSFCELIDTLPS